MGSFFYFLLIGLFAVLMIHNYTSQLVDLIFCIQYCSRSEMTCILFLGCDPPVEKKLIQKMPQLIYFCCIPEDLLAASRNKIYHWMYKETGCENNVFCVQSWKRSLPSLTGLWSWAHVWTAGCMLCGTEPREIAFWILCYRPHGEFTTRTQS